MLGAGGMGAVYEAENTVTGRRVAVKVMLPRAAAVDTAPERFLREARAASRASHPHIVDVLDAGQNPADGCWYIVQELLEGRELRAEFEARGRIPWPATLALLGPVMEALAVVHRQGIVHRDVKPENIFLATTPGGTVPKLIDFGIARLVDGDPALHLTRSGALLGTPNYMAPEQARGLKDLDARVDVWAMGVVLREALTGERPFKGDNYNAMMMSILADPVAPIADVCAGLPPTSPPRSTARSRATGPSASATRASCSTRCAPARQTPSPRPRRASPSRASGARGRAPRGLAGGVLIAAAAFTLGTRAPARPAVAPDHLVAPAVLRALPTPPAPPLPAAPVEPPTPPAAPPASRCARRSPSDTREAAEAPTAPAGGGGTTAAATTAATVSAPRPPTGAEIIRNIHHQ